MWLVFFLLLIMTDVVGFLLLLVADVVGFVPSVTHDRCGWFDGPVYSSPYQFVFFTALPHTCQ